MITLITGGERSGKSRYAQQRALELDANPLYVATSRPWDPEHTERITLHRLERGREWTTVECDKAISTAIQPGCVAVVDCVTLWLTNFYEDTGRDARESWQQARAEAVRLWEVPCILFLVTNEIGMGVHAATEKGRRFVELQGRMNQYLATQADEVVLMVSGVPLTVKGRESAGTPEA